MVNSIFNFFKKPKKSSGEAIVPVSLGKNPNVTETRKLLPGNTHGYFFPDEESWNEFNSVYHHGHSPSAGVVYDMNYYKSSVIEGYVSKEIEKIISKKLKETKNDNLKFLCLEREVAGGDIFIPAIRVECPDNGKSINLKDLLDNDVCKKLRVRTMTICHSDESKTRGLRLVYDESGRRCYEVANGTYEMTLTWYVEEKECKIKVLVHSDKPVELIERNGVTDEQLRAYKEVYLGPQCKAKLLYEALAPQLQQENSKPKSSEEKVKVLSQESSKIKDLVTKNPEAKSALKELESQLQQKSSKEQSSGIKFPEKELKGVTGSRLLTNMPDPTKWDISKVVDQLGGPSTDLREVKNALLLKKGLISEKTLNQLG